MLLRMTLFKSGPIFPQKKKLNYKYYLPVDPERCHNKLNSVTQLCSSILYSKFNLNLKTVCCRVAVLCLNFQLQCHPRLPNCLAVITLESLLNICNIFLPAKFVICIKDLQFFQYLFARETMFGNKMS